jgi:hypothetical protein
MHTVTIRTDKTFRDGSILHHSTTCSTLLRSSSGLYADNMRIRSIPPLVPLSSVSTDVTDSLGRFVEHWVDGFENAQIGARTEMPLLQLLVRYITASTRTRSSFANIIHQLLLLWRSCARLHGSRPLDFEGAC